MQREDACFDLTSESDLHVVNDQCNTRWVEELVQRLRNVETINFLHPHLVDGRVGGQPGVYGPFTSPQPHLGIGAVGSIGFSDEFEFKTASRDPHSR
jgi:hypothetical protein